MACDNLSNTNADSEMEEGEIVDELDELSDISSEEEFLLRQRLQVLENYNNVLERKEAKRTSIGSGKNHRRVKALYDHSQISGTDADDGFSKLKYRITKEHRPSRLPKQKRIKEIDNIRHKDSKKKVQRKKKIDLKNSSDTSEYSDDEYRNKRKKLADAVSFNKVKSDTSTLKDRINKMLCVSKSENHVINIDNKNDEDIHLNNNKRSHEAIKQVNIKVSKEISNDMKSCQLIDLCNDDANIVSILPGIDTGDSITLEKNIEGNSDEDLELLRQHALKTKSKTIEKVVITKEASENKPNLSDEEDSDTAELRLICLKSALLKKAIEMKRKQKLQKKRFQAVQHNLDINTSDCEVNIDNNTDVESVDMDIGSDAEDKGKSLITECDHESGNHNILEDNSYRKKGYKEDELEEDEDLLRAKLLTSLSKNLPNLLNLNMFNSKSDENTVDNIDSVKDIKDIKKDDDINVKSNEAPPPVVVAEEKKFIIHLGESDSEGEHEATKNLTKMHNKLTEQAEFQMKLDNLLKTVRNKTEETILPDVVQKPVKPLQKIVAKAMNHLPKSEQIEYRNLVKRMAELEKIKQARRMSSSGNNQITKETLKPRNVSIDSRKSVLTKNIDEKIALSRKKIAEESSKIINLKEESKKLAQRYKIVSTELRNITTAITINKKQQKAVQDGLSKIRLQHQMLLQGTNRHSNHMHTKTNNKVIASKLQKENNPAKEDHKIPNNLKSLKVSVVNDFNKEITLPRLSVQVDISTNKKNVKLPKSPIKERIVDFKKERYGEDCIKEGEDADLGTDEVSRLKCDETYNKKDNSNDYISPLDALECKNWKEDPNAVLCPFEVGGSCRDPDCKYLHPEIPTQK